MAANPRERKSLQYWPFPASPARAAVNQKVQRFRSSRHLPVAVGIPITRYPPHKTVRARLRIRLPPWIFGVKACHWVRMQDPRERNPSVEERFEPPPTPIATLTAMDQHHPPQSAKPISEDFQLRQVTRNGMIAVVTQNDLLQPLTY